MIKSQQESRIQEYAATRVIQYVPRIYLDTWVHTWAHAMSLSLSLTPPPSHIPHAQHSLTAATDYVPFVFVPPFVMLFFFEP